ncbi:xanthine dehydrogenase accessory protein XdhC [Aquisalimonas sp.]|uniref:xanthine dehydrogenase accessory protein XdhC n=1 Tax=unclassified Aquisalimonas TaxID=2644645 RepID=UPI0025BDE882|nr:xanthine dehydrogenase accessory protein XdhC [Aquisalimonas sp.]
MKPWLDAMNRCVADDVPCVLVTLVGTEGSSPRASGAKMLVTASDSTGTLGGGTVELIAQERAREMITGGTTTVSEEDFTLNDALDQACGGRMRLLFEPFLPSPLTIAIFGAGHVGRALVDVLAGIPCRIHWVDSRQGQFPETVPEQVRTHAPDDPASLVPELPAGTLLVAMTHSHDTDLDILKAALQRDDLGFIGTIGSSTKRGRFMHRLRDAGLGQAAEEHLTCPVGLPGIGGKAPGHIAVSLAAQLLQVAGE